MPNQPIEEILNQVAFEIRSSHSDSVIETKFEISQPVSCDAARIGQLFSNLLGNAVTHGSQAAPIVARATPRTEYSNCRSRTPAIPFLPLQ